MYAGGENFPSRPNTPMASGPTPLPPLYFLYEGKTELFRRVVHYHFHFHLLFLIITSLTPPVLTGLISFPHYTPPVPAEVASPFPLSRQLVRVASVSFF